jgi:CDP-diacylglycerol--glycerol-3-phosphate 3-phosphatidyltransferase
MDRHEYLDRWSELHGYDGRSNPLVHHWLAAAFTVAGPLAAARASPHALSVAGVLSAALGAWAASDTGGWYAAAAGLIVLSGLLDSLDGAVAVLRHRVSQTGAVVDAAADRIGDSLFLMALWLAGAPAAVCFAGWLLMLCHESVRAHARASGRRNIGVVTVSERPTRVIVTAMFLLAASRYDGTLWPALGGWAWVGLGAVGLAQLLVASPRRL